MPLLVSMGLPLLKKYGKTLVAFIVAAWGAIHIYILQEELSDARKEVTAFKLVQKRNEMVIEAQNKAVRNLWIKSQEEEKKATQVGVEAEVSLKKYVKNLKKVSFGKAPCEKGVGDFYIMVKEVLK